MTSITAVRRFIETVGSRDLDQLDALVTGDYRHNVPGQPLTLEELKAMLQTLFAGFPDLTSTIDSIEPDGDGYIVRWTGVGTHRGRFMGVEPTGRSVRIDGCNRFVLSGDLIANDEPRWELGHVMAQIR